MWDITLDDEGTLNAVAAALRFRVKPDCGGTLLAPVWTAYPTLWTPAESWTRPFTSPFYDRYALNTFAASLADGETTALEHDVDGARLAVRGSFTIHDLVIQHTIQAHAESGEIRISDSVSKHGHGTFKLQMMHEFMYMLDASLDGPQARIVLPVAGTTETLWTFEPAGGEVFDQDGHSVRRGRVLSEPWMDVAAVGDTASLRFAEEDELACFMQHSARKRQYVLLNLYGPDFVIGRGETVSKSCRAYVKPSDDGNPVESPAVIAPVRRAHLCERACEVRVRLAEVAGDTDHITRIRLGQAAWKLGEFELYMLDSEYTEAEAMLDDAERALTAVAEGEPAILPKPGAMLYENSLRDFPVDWQLFGFCETKNDPELGFHVQPNMTTNLWTRDEFEGSHVVEFEFCPTSEHTKGGTFLQMCGCCINPRDGFDFMASAMGNMPYYNFGICCYHFSFNRADLSVCNFRKTGKAFYLLAQIAEPVRERGRWYRLHFVKNAAQFLFFVDGTLALEYSDIGNQGEMYSGGRIGLRNWGRQSSWFRNFRVYRPAE